MFDYREAVSKLEDKAASLLDRLPIKTAYIRKELPVSVAKAGWIWLDAGSVFDPKTVRDIVVVGVSPVDKDMFGLQALWEQSKLSPFRVAVFSFDNVVEPDDFLPGLSISIVEHPVVVRYSDGKIVSEQQGSQALAMLRNIRGSGDFPAR